MSEEKHEVSRRGRLRGDIHGTSKKHEGKVFLECSCGEKWWKYEGGFIGLDRETCPAERREQNE